MIRGLYTAVSAMITNQQKQNVVVNNLANMDTNGYKSKQLLTKSFDELKLRVTITTQMELNKSRL